MDNDDLDLISNVRAYSIGEFSEKTGVPSQTLRNWEESFGEGFIVPREESSNQRYYTEEHAELVQLILKWKDELNFSHPQIKQMLIELKRIKSESGRGEPNGPKSSSYVTQQQLQMILSEFSQRISTQLNEHGFIIETKLLENKQNVEKLLLTNKNEESNSDLTERLKMIIKEDREQSLRDFSELINQNNEAINEIKNQLAESANKKWYQFWK